VAGSAAYVDDLREPAGTLHVAVGSATSARGVVGCIDLLGLPNAAVTVQVRRIVRQAPGVVAALTAADIAFPARTT
jgi:xanthine dehydrogenase large subunit